MSKEDDSDLVLRHMARLLPEHFARALAPGAASIKVKGWLDAEVASRKRRLDQVLEVEIDGQPRRQHAEWQLAWSNAIPWRVFEYQALLAMADRGLADDEASLVAPIESTVVLLSGRVEPWPPWMNFRLSPPDALFSGVHFRVEAIYQKSVEELCKRGNLLWLMLAPLARDATEERLPEIVGQLREQAPDEATFHDVGAAMVALAEKNKHERHLGAKLLSLLPREVLMQNMIFRMGEAKGKAEGEAKAVLVVLAARGVEVTEEQRQRIQAEQDLSVLERWLSVALTATQTDDLWKAPRRRARRTRKS